MFPVYRMFQIKTFCSDCLHKPSWVWMLRRDSVNQNTALFSLSSLSMASRGLVLVFKALIWLKPLVVKTTSIIFSIHFIHFSTLLQITTSNEKTEWGMRRTRERIRLTHAELWLAFLFLLSDVFLRHTSSRRPCCDPDQWRFFYRNPVLKHLSDDEKAKYTALDRCYGCPVSFS